MDNDYISIIYYVFTFSSFIVYYYNKHNRKYNSYQPVDNDDLDTQLNNLEENIMNNIELNIPLTQLNSSNKININNDGNNDGNNDCNNDGNNDDNNDDNNDGNNDDNNNCNNDDNNNCNNDNDDNNYKIDENIDINKYYSFDFIRKKTTTFLHK